MSLDTTFAAVVRAALAGERCPISHKYKTDGPTIKSTELRELARLGHARIEVYPRNWRVVHILSGPHAGKSTKPYANPECVAWSVVDARSTPEPVRKVPMVPVLK